MWWNGLRLLTQSDPRPRFTSFKFLWTNDKANRPKNVVLSKLLNRILSYSLKTNSNKFWSNRVFFPWSILVEVNLRWNFIAPFCIIECHYFRICYPEDGFERRVGETKKPFGLPAHKMRSFSLLFTLQSTWCHPTLCELSSHHTIFGLCCHYHFAAKFSEKVPRWSGALRMPATCCI